MEDDELRQPKYAKLLNRGGKSFRIACIHYDSSQVTLQENEKVYNTVSIENVNFDFSDFTNIEREEFCRKFR